MPAGMPAGRRTRRCARRRPTGCGRRAGSASPEQWRFDWERPYTRDEWLDQVPTFGGLSQFPPATRQELLAGIGAAVDALGGSFTMGYATVAASAARI